MVSVAPGSAKTVADSMTQPDDPGKRAERMCMCCASHPGRGDWPLCKRCEPAPIAARLLRSLEPRHVAALQRLDAAQRRGSDMQARAVLAGPEMQQLLTAAREAG